MIDDILILIRGAGDLASGVAWRLHRCGYSVVMTEIERPLWFAGRWPSPRQSLPARPPWKG